MNNTFLRRLFLFGIGFTVSSIFVYFFMYANRDLPAFWPAGKVKEKIGKSMREDKSDSCYYSCLNWDEAELKKAVDEGEVYFSRSKPRTKPCPEYQIGVKNPTLGAVRVNIRSCDSSFTLLDVFEDAEEEKELCLCGEQTK
jgi:hypothetical protein